MARRRSAANHALDELVDLSAPTGTPAPLEDLLDASPVSDGTVDLSGGRAPTRVGAPATISGSGLGTRPTMAGAAPRLEPPASPAPSASQIRLPRPASNPGSRSEPPKSNTGVIAAGFVGLIFTLGGGVYMIANKLESNKLAQNQLTAPSPSPLAETTTTTPAPTPVPVATAAPPPKFEAPAGKAASIALAASDAFGKGDYDKAIQKAQEALREDPGSTAAQKILDQARNGKEAHGKLAAARTALASKDFARARQIAQDASRTAPWDEQVNGVLNEISRAEAAEQAQAASAAQAKALQEKSARETEINTLLSRATAALGSDKFDEAVALYSEVLKIDPGNGPAQSGQIGAMTAKRAALAAAAAAAATTAPAPPPSGKTFSNGRTEKKAGAQTGLGAAGFGEAVGVKSATQGADMPGSVSFELQPKNPRPGDNYKVVVKFTNEGSAPIALTGLTVRLNINGKGVGAAQPIAVSSVAPGDTAIVYSAGEVWSDSITEWAYTATVMRAQGRDLPEHRHLEIARGVRAAAGVQRCWRRTHARQ